MFGLLRLNSRESTPIPQHVEPPPPRSMAPVPQGTYATREDLMNDVKAWARTQGYAIVISRSRANRLWLKCDRGGRYENRRKITDDQRKRKRGDSRLMGCPFGVIAVLKDDLWKVKTEVENHNHGPSEDLTAHPSLRKMTKEQTLRLEEMTDAGNSPSEIMHDIKLKWPDINVVKRDIYNARKKHKDNKALEVAEEPTGEPTEEFDSVTSNGANPPPAPLSQAGQWVWEEKAETGDEDTTKPRKKHQPRRNAYAPATPRSHTLDPQLHASLQPSAQPPSFQVNDLPNNFAFQDMASYADPGPINLLQPAANPQSQVPGGRHRSAPDNLQPMSTAATFGNVQDGTSYSDTFLDNGSLFFQQPQAHPQRNSFPTVSASRFQQSQQQQQPAPPVFPPPSLRESVMATPQLRKTRSAAVTAANNQGNGPPSPHTAPAPVPAPTQDQKKTSGAGQVFMERFKRLEQKTAENEFMLRDILSAVSAKKPDQ